MLSCTEKRWEHTKENEQYWTFNTLLGTEVMIQGGLPWNLLLPKDTNSGHAKSQCCQCDNLAEPTRGPKDSSLFMHEQGQKVRLRALIGLDSWSIALLKLRVTVHNMIFAYHLSLTHSPSVQGEISGIKSDQTCAVNSRRKSLKLPAVYGEDSKHTNLQHCALPGSTFASWKQPSCLVRWLHIPLRGSNTIESEQLG